MHLSVSGSVEVPPLVVTPLSHRFVGVAGFLSFNHMHSISSLLSSSNICNISSLSFWVPCLEISRQACEAGYAHRLSISGMRFCLPGIYPTERSNLEKIWCHRDLLPNGPLGVSRTSLVHDSKLL